MKRIIQYGAGNIGRGFIAQLFSRAGYEVVFVDVNEPLVKLLNEKKKYTLVIVDNDSRREVVVDKVRAVSGLDRAAVAKEISEAEIVVSSVGVNILPRIAPVIADGIRKRSESGSPKELNIIICENLLNAGAITKKYILDSLNDARLAEYVENKVGFIESVVSRMIPPVPKDVAARDLSIVFAEPYEILPVDKNGFKGEIPVVEGISPIDNLHAYEEQKLFIHNLGHATTAYLGYLKGYTYIYESIADPGVAAAVRAALGESGKALNLKHGFTPEHQQAHIEDLIKRFGNKALGDTVYRVGREPLRKLGPNDRFAGAMKLCRQFGILPENIALGVAACLLYDYKEDPQALENGLNIKVKGLVPFLAETSGLGKDTGLLELIARKYDFLMKTRNKR